MELLTKLIELMICTDIYAYISALVRLIAYIAFNLYF